MQSRWFECEGDAHPCIAVSFGTKKDEYANVHFDTGCKTTVFDVLYLRSQGVDFRDAVLVDLLEETTGEYLDAWSLEVNMVLRDGQASRAKQRVIVAVDQWLASPYVFSCEGGECPGSSAVNCGYRTGLVGRDILVSHGSILLDAEERVSRLH